MDVTEATPLCLVEWFAEPDDFRHSCYLDEDHSGTHCCGYCDEKREHPE